METKVRVGVRVRPLLPNEKAFGSEMVLKYPADSQIGVGERYFTYDHVFSPEVSQERLYQQTAGPMLKSFLDGYNVTILAYGQTGSGKTYTMGSEASHFESVGSTLEAQGLIPRFLDDLFRFLSSEEREASVSASFLEIYGEDIFDLLEEADDTTVTSRRVPLPVREDAQGVVVAGLKQIPVSNRMAALNVLRRGTMNRTTAATLMNVVSSRSHAVFTVTLHQVVHASDNGGSGGGAAGSGGGGGGGGSEEDEGQVVVSKLTFVDLAGSERLKKTGAEGTRRREGIQINVGLLALGNVINALADEERLAKGKQVHVPYRQSKLTRLLQDALGGNSQTLFLACVSPAEMNVSETLSTLHYANRARNISNKPVKNTDSVKEELRCLRQMAHFLKTELVRVRFGASEGEEDLMERQDVVKYLESLGEKLNGQLTRMGVEGVDGKVLITRPFTPATPKRQYKSPTGGLLCPLRPMFPLSAGGGGGGGGGGELASPARSDVSCFSLHQNSSLLREEGDESAGPHHDDDDDDDRGEGTDGFSGDPEREMEILQKLRELQRQEGELGEAEERGTQELAVMQGELDQKEELLQQLKQTLEGYHSMKAKFEKLQSELEALEAEKVALTEQLEKNKGVSEAAGGGGAAVSKLKDKLKTVEAQLDRLRVQKQEQENIYKLTERQKQAVKELEESVSRLKSAKVQLMRKQKEASKAAQEAIQQKRKEVETLRKAGRQKDRSMGKLQLENRTHKLLLDRKDQCIKGLKEKVARSEAHVSRLLSLQTRTREVTAATAGRPKPGTTSRPAAASGPAAKAAAKRSEEKIQAVKCLLEQSIEDRLQEAEARRLLDIKVKEYEALMGELKAQAATVEDLKEADDEDAMREAERRVEELDVQMELCASAIEDLRTRLEGEGGETTAASGGGSKAGGGGAAALDARIMMDLEGAEARTLLLSLVDMTVEAKRAMGEMAGELRKRACAEEGLKMERSRLERRLSEVGRGFEHRMTEMKMQHQRDLVTVTRGVRGCQQQQQQQDGDLVEEDDDDEVGKRQFTALLAQIEGLEARCQSLAEEARCKGAEADSAKAEAEEGKRVVQDLQQTLKVVMEPERSSSSKAAPHHQKVVEEMTGLQELWRTLGLEEEEKTRLADEIVNAASTLRSSFLSSARQRLASTQEGIREATKQLGDLYVLLGRPPVPPPPSAGGPLLVTLRRLEEQVEAARKVFAERKERRQQLAQEACKLEAAIGANIDSRSPALIRLLQGAAAATTSTPPSEDGKVTGGDGVDDGSEAQSSSTTIIREEDMKEWEAEVGALHRARSKLLLEVEEVMDRIRGKCTMLALDSKALDGVLQLAVQTERAGHTVRAKTLQDSMLSVVCTLATTTTTTATGRSPSDLEGGHHKEMLQTLTPFLAHARFVLEIVSECERARVELGGLLAAAAETLTSEECLGSNQEDANIKLSIDGRAMEGSPVSPQVFTTWVSAVEGSIQAVGGSRREEGRQQVERLASELGVPLAMALAGGPNKARGQEASKRLAQVQARVRESSERARVRRYPEAWQTAQLTRLGQALDKMEGRVAEIGRERAALAWLDSRKSSRATILRLNDEVTVMEAKVRQFETDNSDRTRLTDRKTNSSRFLREEKFRKDSQARLAKLMEALRHELEEWEKREGSPFDRALLGEEIRRALVEGSSRGWVEGRTELMHLHTTSSSRSQSRGASPTDFGSSSEGAASESPPHSFPPAPPTPTTISSNSSSTTSTGPARDPFARILSTGGSGSSATTTTSMGTTPSSVGGNLLCLNRLLAPGNRPVGMDLHKVLGTTTTTTGSKWGEEDGQKQEAIAAAQRGQENSPNNRNA